jgi:homoserine dehydrogenase
VILTHITQEKNINQAIVAIEQLSALDGQVVKLRMEALSR